MKKVKRKPTNAQLLERVKKAERELRAIRKLVQCEDGFGDLIRRLYACADDMETIRRAGAALRDLDALQKKVDWKMERILKRLPVEASN